MSVGGIGGFSAASMASRLLGKADKDGSGGLSLDEFAATASSKGGNSVQSSEKASAIFSALDSDADGAISEGELASGIEAFASETATALLGVQERGAGGPPPGGPPPGGPPPGGPPPGGARGGMFEETDEDESGTLSLDEFTATLSELGASEDEISELFATIDEDGDGEISEAENAAFEEEMQANRPPPPGGPGGPPPSGALGGSDAAQQIADLLAASDADSSGTVSLEELAATGEELGLSSDDVESLFSALDSDADGAVDEDETAAFGEAVSAAMSAIAANAYASRSSVDLVALFDAAA